MRCPSIYLGDRCRRDTGHGWWHAYWNRTGGHVEWVTP
jgi:hypothetical protein